ncbi:MAG: oligosaccharide flippase family protein [Actinobacteria bacterium]|nr:oligosaccharide flippase family protein [Actinomycetota bacterium]
MRERAPGGRVAATASTYGAAVAVGVLGLANALVVARALGPTGRGQIAFIVAVAALTARLSTLGIEQANANFGGREPETRSALATNSAVFAAGAGAMAFVVLELIAKLAPGAVPGGELGAIGIATVPLLILATQLDMLVRAEYATNVANAAWIAGPVVTLTANGVLFAGNLLSVRLAVATWMAGQAASLALLVWYLLARGSGFGRPSVHLARRSLRLGIQSYIGGVFGLGNARLDQWLLGAISGPRALGLYSVAVAWSETLFYLPTAIVAVQRPDLVRAAPDDAARQTAIGFRLAAALTLPAAAVVVVAAPQLCTGIFGNAFHDSALDLRILVIGTFGITGLKLLGNALIAQGRPLRQTASVGVAFTVTAILDVALIPLYADLGASIAAAVAYSCGGLAAAAIFARTFGCGRRELVPHASDLAVLWQRLRPARA